MYDLSVHIPSSVFSGDKPTAHIEARNNSNTIIGTEALLSFSGASPITLSGSMILNIEKTESLDIPFKVPDDWR